MRGPGEAMSESNGVGEDVIRRIEGGIAWIVLNRPERVTP